MIVAIGNRHFRERDWDKHRCRIQYQWHFGGTVRLHSQCVKTGWMKRQRSLVLRSGRRCAALLLVGDALAAQKLCEWLFEEITMFEAHLLLGR